MAWKDTSSFSQSDTERQPNEFRLKNGDIEIVVHRYLGLPGWFYSCHELRVSASQLKSKHVLVAQRQAIALVKHRAAKLNSYARGLTAAANREVPA